ncbi:hypothetical protein EIP86_009444 [Pleurotus ostreatoroseus]|nr:hypothetical protein EIP86_009444 [Pleurotus ostreatoroseus]
MNERDLQHLFKDTSVPLPTPDGRVQNYVTYRLGVQPVPRNISLILCGNPSPLTGVGQVKMPPGAMQQVRISSANGVIRPPGTPVVPALPTQASPPRNASPAVNESSPSRMCPHAGVCGNGMVKSALASLQADSTFQGNGHVALGRANTNYAEATFSQQLIAARQRQWATISQGNQCPASALVDASINGGVETTLAANLGMNVNIPVCAPSTNGQRQARLAQASKRIMSESLRPSSPCI